MQAVTFCSVGSVDFPTVSGKVQSNAHYLGNFIKNNQAAMPLLDELLDYGAVLFMQNPGATHKIQP